MEDVYVAICEKVGKLQKLKRSNDNLYFSSEGGWLCGRTVEGWIMVISSRQLFCCEDRFDFQFGSMAIDWQLRIFSGGAIQSNQSLNKIPRSPPLPGTRVHYTPLPAAGAGWGVFYESNPWGAAAMQHNTPENSGVYPILRLPRIKFSGNMTSPSPAAQSVNQQHYLPCLLSLSPGASRHSRICLPGIRFTALGWIAVYQSTQFNSPRQDPGGYPSHFDPPEAIRRRSVRQINSIILPHPALHSTPPGISLPWNSLPGWIAGYQSTRFDTPGTLVVFPPFDSQCVNSITSSPPAIHSTLLH